MGVLADRQFWANALNQLARLEPAPGGIIDKRDALRIREISCEALSALLNDPEFDTDLKEVIARHAHHSTNSRIGNFADFLETSMFLEAKLLADAGVNSSASRDLEREIRRVANDFQPGKIDRLKDKISYLRRLACEPHAADDPKRPLWSAVWRGVKGVGLIGIDVGSAATAAALLGPAYAAAAGALVGDSIGFGYTLLDDALKGRW